MQARSILSRKNMTLLKTFKAKSTTLTMLFRSLVSALLTISALISPPAECCLSDSRTPSGPAPFQNLPPEQYNNLSNAQAAPSSNFAPTEDNRNSFPKGCGHSKYWNEPKSRVVGGVSAMPNEFPWQVRLLIGGKSLCGATILNDRWIITAAHCAVLTTSPSQIKAIFGDHDRGTTEVHEKTMSIDRIVVHPRYNSNTMDYDFALLRLPWPLNFDKWEIQPVCLPKSCDDECNPGDYAFLSGWGTTSEQGSSSRTLQKAKAPIITNQQCSSAYSTSAARINSVKICAGYDGGRLDSCQGDSGGPMTCPSYGYFMLMGVVSYGRGCGRSGYYGVYSRVCKVLTWIKDTVGYSRSLYFFSTTNASSPSTNETEDSPQSFYNNLVNTPENSGKKPIISVGQSFPPPAPSPVTNPSEMKTTTTNTSTSTTTGQGVAEYNDYYYK